MRSTSNKTVSSLEALSGGTDSQSVSPVLQWACPLSINVDQIKNPEV